MRTMPEIKMEIRAAHKVRRRYLDDQEMPVEERKQKIRLIELNLMALLMEKVETREQLNNQL